MKNTISFCLVFLAFILSGINLHAQTPKLNTAFYYSSYIVIDSKGNAFVTGKNNKIIKITPDGKAQLFAGGGRNDKDGQGKEAAFSNTNGIAIDAENNLYITDNTRIRKITPDGMVSTIAGVSGTESKDGDKSTASFLRLENIAIDNNGNIYVTDLAPLKNRLPGKVANTGEYNIRKITPQGIVSTLQNGNESKLQLKYPRGLTCDNAGNLYISASVSHCIKKITPDGIITTVAGQCDKTIFHSVYKEGNIATAVLTSPGGIAIANNGDIYISDNRLNRIIKIANNKVATVAGCGKIDFTGNIAGASEAGERDGKASQAMFYTPAGIAFDKAGKLYIVDGSSRTNSYIRILAPDGMVSTFCKHSWNPKTQQYEEAD